MRAHYTVVYRVDGDIAAHDAWWQAIRPLFLADSTPVSISVISKADEVARLDCIRHIVDSRLPHAVKVEAIDELLRTAGG